MELDAIDRNILRVLQADGRVSNVALAERVALSESPCFRRVRQLEQSGLIKGYAALLDQERLGLEVTAFVLVTMEKQPDAATEQFIARVREEAHIVECYATSGAHDYLMKVVAESVAHFSELCMQRILKFPGVLHVESSFSLQAIKQDQGLPV